ncbi:MAG: hypothetical protein ACI90V_000680, partial [Bacillariaceae sp.]|jgi:hypothetical protein
VEIFYTAVFLLLSASLTYDFYFYLIIPRLSLQMFNRILQLQKNEYGPHDRRCFVTVDKINMVQSKGVQYEDAIEELRKTFSMPSAPASVSSSPSIISSIGTTKVKQSPRRDKNVQPQRSSSGKNKKKKNKVMQVLSSMRKTNP